jgi:putative aminophosphonate oxidoreductase
VSRGRNSGAGPHRSLWLQEVAGDAADAPPLGGSNNADVAIVGGGYVGLWTAIHIKKLDPSCDVALFEGDICGGGASGRNGGFVLSWWPKLASLSRLFGLEEAVRIGRQSEAAAGEIGEFCGVHRIDADFRRGGWLWTATTSSQLGSWEAVVRLCERAGVEPFRRLDPLEVASRSGSAVHRAGVFDASAAIVQPAALARGLRRVALSLGVRIYEHTKVQSFSRGRPVLLRCPQGTLRADRLVLATNAWSASLPEVRRAIVVVSSDMVATAPIPDRLEAIGWERDLAISDSQMMVDYYRPTRDGRIAFGKGGWTIGLGGRIGSSFDRHPQRAAEVRADLHRTYPMLSGVAVTHDWSGPIDRTPDSLPLLGLLGGREHIAYGVGWSGNGVGPSLLGGKILASLALGRNDEWARHPMVGRRAERLPPEPIRFVGAHVVRAAVVRKERAEREERKPSRLSVALAKLAPAGFEDKT